MFYYTIDKKFYFIKFINRKILNFIIVLTSRIHV